ncbi:MAG: phosphoribosylglycinamide synthetase C domain-containing protein, partial [Verrucomicrobiota bacterium]
ERTLSRQTPEWLSASAACVILASGGYPGSYEKGKPISGIANADSQPDVVVFHAGTKPVDGSVQTNGGRVLGVTALGNDLAEARAKAYAAADLISFDGLQRRNDIGAGISK